MEHSFLFFPGQWLGEGNITFSSSPEVLHFYTSWKSAQDQIWVWTQKVQIVGNEEEMVNTYTIHEVSGSQFFLTLNNTWVGEVSAEGLTDAKKIEWTYTNPQVMSGGETYFLQENGEYLFHAEFHTQDLFRIKIEGKLWRSMPDDAST